MAKGKSGAHGPSFKSQDKHKRSKRQKVKRSKQDNIDVMRGILGLC